MFLHGDPPSHRANHPASCGYSYLTGFNANRVSGFALGLGIERITMIKLGIDDIHQLWKSPYVPEG